MSAKRSPTFIPSHQRPNMILTRMPLIRETCAKDREWTIGFREWTIDFRECLCVGFGSSGCVWVVFITTQTTHKPTHLCAASSSLTLKRRSERYMLCCFMRVCRYCNYICMCVFATRVIIREVCVGSGARSRLNQGVHITYLPTYSKSTGVIKWLCSW